MVDFSTFCRFVQAHEFFRASPALAPVCVGGIVAGMKATFIVLLAVLLCLSAPAQDKPVAGREAAAKAYDEGRYADAVRLFAAGLQMPKGQPADGVDLLPFINGKNTSKPHEWLCWQNRSWFPRQKGGYGVPAPKVHNSAIRKGNWKLVRMNEKIGSDDPPPAWQLYDLKNDIGEQKDLANQHGDMVKELGAQFNKWRSSMHPTVE